MYVTESRSSISIYLSELLYEQKSEGNLRGMKERPARNSSIKPIGKNFVTLSLEETSGQKWMGREVKK